MPTPYLHHVHRRADGSVDRESHAAIATSIRRQEVAAFWSAIVRAISRLLPMKPGTRSGRIFPISAPRDQKI
jgi:hypothetical protein